MTIITKAAAEIKEENSPIVHGRQRLLHPSPGVEGLRLEGRVVLDVAEHGHGEAPGLGLTEGTGLLSVSLVSSVLTTG